MGIRVGEWKDSYRVGNQYCVLKSGEIFQNNSNSSREIENLVYMGSHYGFKVENDFNKTEP